MTKRIEFRKHGPFDLRYASIRLKPPPASLRRSGAAELDWHDFRALFFPASRRHESDSLAAYESYRTTTLPLTSKQGGREEMQDAAPLAALLMWESEGGAGRERSVR